MQNRLPLGEFFFNFHQAAARGQMGDHHVETSLCLGEMIGLQQALSYIARDATPQNFDDAHTTILTLLPFAGEDLHAFFGLGFDTIAVRGSTDTDSAKHVEAVLKKVQRTLETDCAPYFDYRIVSAWRQVCEWWRSGNAGHEELLQVVQLFHGSFLTFGAQGAGELGKAAHMFGQEIHDATNKLRG